MRSRLGGVGALLELKQVFEEREVEARRRQDEKEP
jgi:hypothetical protein